MNINKFCFIMCVNDEERALEAIHYIERLHVPEGYEIDVLTVQEAPSLTAGYNEAMKATDAKYKIYMHQDILLVEQDILFRLLEIFADESIGMVGVVGVANPPENGMVWYGGNIGKLYFRNMVSTSIQEFDEPAKPYSKVATIDGIFMATQYDIPWREDIFTGWDFYDASQSIEFYRKGYQVVVPYQEKPWLLHDEGAMNLKNYYTYRKVFVREYREELQQLRKFAEENTDNNQVGFDISYYANANSHLIQWMDKKRTEKICVLEVGCGTGATLSLIQREYPNAEVHGIELVPEVAQIGQRNHDIIDGNIETMELPYDYNQFDYVIFGDVLEHLCNPENVLRRLIPYLTENGCFICSIPNIMHVSVMYSLLKGEFEYQDSGIMDRTHMRFFTKKSIENMFNRIGFSVERLGYTENRCAEKTPYKEFLDWICSREGNADITEFQAFQYLIRARKRS